jgi:hypothetical protein
VTTVIHPPHGPTADQIARLEQVAALNGQAHSPSFADKTVITGFALGSDELPH